jgi:hypothetical protein
MEREQSDLERSEPEARHINLDEILDPYERMRGNYFIVEIAKAEYCDHRKLDHTEFIALELIVVERGDDTPKVTSGKYKYKGKKLFLNISLDPKKVWLLKNLCNALHISGEYDLHELAVALVGMKVKARVISRYDNEFDEYFYIINRFRGVSQE